MLSSHRWFAENFKHYVDLFDEVMLLGRKSAPQHLETTHVAEDINLPSSKREAGEGDSNVSSSAAISTLAGAEVPSSAVVICYKQGPEKELVVSEEQAYGDFLKTAALNVDARSRSELYS